MALIRSAGSFESTVCGGFEENLATIQEQFYVCVSGIVLPNWLL